MPESVFVKADPLRVVVADDDDAMRTLLRIMLGFVDRVEIVGEARDGYEAVLLAQETHPHLVILDVRMPRLDGIGAAEALLAANPDIQLIVHTAEVHSDRLREAERLGIRINDKADPEALVKRLEAVAARTAETPSTQSRLNTAVLAALLGAAPGQGLAVALPDGEIPFYNYTAAEFFRWPYPPKAMHLVSVRESRPTFDLTGKRITSDERPINRAFTTRLPTPEEELVVLRDGVFIPVVTGATPLFDEGGEFLGVASYFRTTERDLSGFHPELDW